MTIPADKSLVATFVIAISPFVLLAVRKPVAESGLFSPLQNTICRKKFLPSFEILLTKEIFVIYFEYQNI